MAEQGYTRARISSWASSSRITQSPSGSPSAPKSSANGWPWTPKNLQLSNEGSHSSGNDSTPSSERNRSASSRLSWVPRPTMSSVDP